MKNKFKAFTLAEVLITITIIGIVAMETIPSLVVSIKNKDTVARLKKVYSVLSQATTQLQDDGIDMITIWKGSSVSEGSVNARDFFERKLIYAKKGANSWPDVIIKYLNDTDTINFSALTCTAILNDGTVLAFFSYNTDCTTVTASGSDSCGYVYTDINGFKQPNIVGRDVFVFMYTKTKVVPYGNSINNCSLAASGESCAYRVFMEDAINY